MPNKNSGRKALRQSKKHALANKERREKIKGAIKAVVKAVNKEKALELVRLAQKTLDKAAKNGVIKKNNASRKLSRLMRKINVMVKK